MVSDRLFWASLLCVSGRWSGCLRLYSTGWPTGQLANWTFLGNDTHCLHSKYPLCPHGPTAMQHLVGVHLRVYEKCTPAQILRMKIAPSYNWDLFHPARKGRQSIVVNSVFYAFTSFFPSQFLHFICKWQDIVIISLNIFKIFQCVKIHKQRGSQGQIWILIIPPKEDRGFNVAILHGILLLEVLVFVLMCRCQKKIHKTFYIKTLPVICIQFVWITKALPQILFFNILS